MRSPLMWLLVIVVAKTALLQGRSAMLAGVGTDYLMVVGSMLAGMLVNVILLVGYAVYTRPRRWGLLIGLLVGLTIMEYVIAKGVIYAFGITP
jgi:hypothetical protein